VIEGPPKGNYWRYSEEKLWELHKDNRIWWGKDGTGVPAIKRFLSEVQSGIVPQTLWLYSEVGHTQDAKKEFNNILHDVKLKFDTPKPSSLIDRILEIATSKDSIVLDSFAGSGTTAHSVLKLNKKDGGKRKFIMIEMEDYAETVTSERIKRIISGNEKHEGTGGSFDYYLLGKHLFGEDGNFNEEVGILKIRSYIYYTETKKQLEEKKQKDNEAFLGKHNDTAYYFHYQPDDTTTLDHQFLATMKTKAEQYVVYADNCLLTKDYLTKHNIVFKKIPRDVSRF
jgi:adenine-specific DNA-methyltransferase